jgi:AcrR family transcriptional regulator
METPNRQAQRSEQSRQKIVQAALTVFGLKGYRAASMEDVSLAAGCSKGGLYHHFPTKPALLAAVVDQLIARGALLPPFHATSGEPAVPSALVGRVLIEVWAEANRDDALRERLRAAYEAALDARLNQEPTGVLPLTDLLRIGTLVQLLTQGQRLDAGEVARQLGIEEAA